MKMYKIDVDEEVYQFLQGKAEPFRDTTPNSVLRKMLLGQRDDPRAVTGHVDLPNDFFVGVPKALSQIGKVIYLAKKHGYTRTDATNKVAETLGVTPQTVIDKYTRQLGKKAFEIDRLLEDRNLGEFEALLTSSFPNYPEVVGAFFARLGEKEPD